MSDWAKKIAKEIEEGFVEGGLFFDKDKKNLLTPTEFTERKLLEAKADGVRVAADYAFTSYRVALNDLAAKIERGEI